MIGDNIKRLREEHGLTQTKLGDICGVTDKAVSTWEQNIKNPRMGALQKMSNYFGIPISAIIEDEDADNLYDKSILMDVVGNITAGYNGIAQMDTTSDSFAIPYEWIKGHKPSDFVLLKVKGDSMYPTVCDADFCLIQLQSTMDYSGQIGAMIFDDESVTLKKINFVYGEDWLELEPINKEFMTKRVEGERLEHCRVLGVLKRLIRKF